MRAVCRADLTQLCAGALHQVRQAKRAADLDQLAARNDRLAPGRKRVQGEHQRAGIIVDRERRLGAGQPREPAGDVIVALTAPAAIEIVFERCRRAHRFDRGNNRLFGQGRTPEIGVQYRAGQIEDAALRRLRHPRQPFAAIGEHGIDGGGLAAAAISGERAAHRIDNEGAAVQFNQRLSAG
jgi:hypothetical protein